jgi:hypothetical protein
MGLAHNGNDLPGNGREVQSLESGMEETQATLIDPIKAPAEMTGANLAVTQFLSRTKEKRR